MPTTPIAPMTVVPSAALSDPSPDWATDNKFLNGPFTPWLEQSEAYDLEVVGQIPADLAGALFRVSSNPRFQPAQRRPLPLVGGRRHGLRRLPARRQGRLPQPLGRRPTR